MLGIVVNLSMIESYQSWKMGMEKETKTELVLVSSLQMMDLVVQICFFVAAAP